MKFFEVKVCGLTRPKDAALAVRLGCDIIGMIFYRKSPRLVSQSIAKSIISAVLPTVRRTGVFVDLKPDAVLRVACRLQLDYVQLHGSYSIKDIDIVRKEGFKVIEAFHVETQKDYERVMTSHADLVLLDNKTTSQSGGTGQRFNWGIVPPRKIPNLVLAGGICSNNVKEGIKRFSPLVIDVNSGVESSPGIKSETKLRDFFSLCNRLRYGSKK
ncbi:MAG: N-(5'-phosphoribosyl)anthranilate isomerase [Candidatus Zixiibacteriota bacterium]|nr:MAG: N-(5'-phosphoribosyl)anthranilate isomerase [candidate division Zixibacteria bacterium]